jgi:glutathione-regulated potassium-efflux system ancillary protein KefF
MNYERFFKYLSKISIIQIFCIFFMATTVTQATELPNKTNIKTLVIVSHPYPERSVMTRGLQQAAESIQGVTVRNLETIYGFDTRAIDGPKEREITRQYDRIVFMFPTHWFNITPMMKAYLNDVWGSVGPGLWQGKEMLLVTTAGGGSSTYGKTGRIGVDLKDVFTPMKASALHAGMTYLTPLAFQAVSSSKLPEYQQQLIERLKR